MPRLLNRTLTLTLAAAWLAGAATVAHAQAAAPAAKPAAPAAKPAAKPAAAPLKKAAKPVKAPPPEVPLPAADADQQKAAAMTHIGAYQCEMNQSIELATNPKYDGYVDVSFNKQKYTMKPVLSSTGALRLEDVKGQTLMIQIAYKSMLMDVRAGHRLVDECVHEKQAAAKKAAEGQASQGLMGGS
ncbi:hypothetical protein [Ideonella sp.]|uniref:hypothetical protein n=1 Tax=Ideonella sp. TaxID=1929293 RepID=UPI0035B48E3E